MKNSTAVVGEKVGEVKAAVDAVEEKVDEFKTAVEIAVGTGLDLPQKYAEMVVTTRSLLFWIERYFMVLPPTNHYMTEYKALKARIEAKL